MITIADHWKAFTRLLADDSISLQFRCHSGCNALDFTLRHCWTNELLAEWGELMTLAHAALEEAQTLTILAATTQGHLSHGQWLYKLESFIEMRNPARHQPTFSDVAVLCGLKQHARMNDSHYVEWIRALVELESIKTRCAPEARDFNELTARRGLALLEQARIQGRRFSPFFGEMNPTLQTQLRAA